MAGGPGVDWHGSPKHTQPPDGRAAAGLLRSSPRAIGVSPDHPTTNRADHGAPGPRRAAHAIKVVADPRGPDRSERAGSAVESWEACYASSRDPRRPDRGCSWNGSSCRPHSRPAPSRPRWRLCPGRPHARRCAPDACGRPSSWRSSRPDRAGGSSPRSSPSSCGSGRTGWPPSPESARPRRASGVPKASAGGPSRSHETELTGPRTAALKRWRPTQPRDAGLEEAPSGRRRNGRDRRSRPETSPASRRTRPTTRGASTRRRVRVARRSSFHRPGRPPCLNGDHDRPRATVRSGRCSRLDGDSGRRTRATISRPVSRTPSSGTSRSLGRVFERAVAWGKRLRPSSHVTSLIR